MIWKDEVTGKSYHNERPIGVQQTAWHLTSQMRKFLPDPIGTILWFGVDDTAHSVHVPFYNSVSRVSKAWADEGIQHVDGTSASLKVDFGKEIGVKQSSAQITHYYNEENLKGKQVIGVCNFPEKKFSTVFLA